MFDQRLRPVKSRALQPLASRLESLPPMALTASGLAIGLGAAALAWLGLWVPALVAWLLNRLADGLDGELARARGEASDRGGYADLVADMVVYSAIPLGVAAGRGGRAEWIAAALLLATFAVNIVTVTQLAAVREKRSSGAAARGEATTTTLPSGLVEGAETMVFLTVIVALPGLAAWSMGIMAVAVAATAITRFAQAWSTLAPEPRRQGLERPSSGGR